MPHQYSPASALCPKCSGARVEMILTGTSQRFRCLSCGQGWDCRYLDPESDPPAREAAALESADEGHSDWSPLPINSMRR